MRSWLVAAALAAPLFAIGCGDDGPVMPDPGPVDACSMGETRSFLISTLSFTREDPKTHLAAGFDLDGIRSDGKDAESCFKMDFVSPDGETGIDNQLAGLIPDVDALAGGGVDTMMQGAINNGDLLILMDVEGVDDIENDPCVNVTVRSVKGRPMLGTDGIVEAYQTFDPDPKSEVSHGQNGKIEDGVLSVGPFELTIPIAIFDVAFKIHVHDAHIRFRVSGEDGIPKTGLLGGGCVPQEILDGVAPGAGVDQYIPLLTVVLNGSTDLAPDADGACQQLSATLQITTVEAFVRQ